MSIFTEKQKEYIATNRYKLSMRIMSENLGAPLSRVRKFMIDNDLNLTKEEVQFYLMRKNHEPIKVEGNRPYVEWVPNPWDRGLNYITMLK